MNTGTYTRLRYALSICVLACAAVEARADTVSRIDTSDCSAPAYRRDWEANEESGQVLLSFQVDAKGKVTSVKLVESSGWSDLDLASVRALKRCVFKGATPDSKSWESMRYTWVLK